MQKVLIVTPHFPPDTRAATHRMRLLAPHLRKFGWEPTIATVAAEGYGCRLDPDLAEMVDPTLKVLRAGALPVAWTRRVGVGDLGLRSFYSLYKLCAKILSSEAHDALLITLYPAYTTLIAPLLKRKFNIPYVIDYQDPWVAARVQSTGGAKDAKADLKRRLTRAMALRLEPIALSGVSAITAVSKGTYEPILERNPRLRNVTCAAIPLGIEKRDFDKIRQQPRQTKRFDPGDGFFHLCYVGTLPPLGLETLRALFKAVSVLRDRQPATYRKLRIHFFGTSAQRAVDAACMVLPVARDLGVEDRVTEIPFRIDYLEALAVQTSASALLLLGSSEGHYTASRLYPALLSGRPMLAAYHSASSVVEILRSAVSEPDAYLVEYDDTIRAENKVEELVRALSQMIDSPVNRPVSVNTDCLEKYSAETLAGSLAEVLNKVSQNAYAKSQLANGTCATA